MAKGVKKVLNDAEKLEAISKIIGNTTTSGITVDELKGFGYKPVFKRGGKVMIGIEPTTTPASVSLEELEKHGIVVKMNNDGSIKSISMK